MIMPKMDILIGTKNQYKATEMEHFLKGLEGIKTRLLAEMGEVVDVDEDQTTLKANAEKKAVEISRHTDWSVLASDGGVDIPGLGKKWDILRNQRTVGENKPDKEKVEVLIGLMKGLKGESRRCAYHLALALARRGRLLWSFQDISDVGYIIEKPEDLEIPPYRWMGHIWYYPQYKKTFNQMSEAERGEIRKQGAKIKAELHRYLGQKCQWLSH
jgi:inosine/xanthosine triphosphate pyrophosphatase family protein